MREEGFSVTREGGGAKRHTVGGGNLPQVSEEGLTVTHREEGLSVTHVGGERQ